MVRLLLLIINLYYCAGFLPDGNLPGDPQMDTLPSDDGDPGEPLFLTPYIENGKIEEAQQRALVTLHTFEHIKSYSGFLTVDKTHNTNLFFWYFPANQTSPYHNPRSAEVIIYLTSSFFTDNVHSLYGLFQENGPIRLLHGKYNVYAEERELSLNKHRHVIYIDHAPGMGFSFTDDWRGYPTSSRKIGELLYTATLQIFKLFPDLQTKYLSIMGEMVGAKYATQLAYLIDENKPTAEINIKLQRLYLISPWIDPMHQVGYYHKHALEVGLIDENMAEVTLGLQQKVQSLIIQRKWNQAFLFYMILYRELKRVTGKDFMSNLSDEQHYTEHEKYYFGYWIFMSYRRKALHVGNLPFKYNLQNWIGWDTLKDDHMQSVDGELYILARKGYIIFFANGPLSIVVPFRAMYETMKKIDDRTNVVQDILLSGNYTYAAHLYIGAMENSNTIAVLHQKVGNYPWIDQPELTWYVVDMLHDFLPPGVGEEDGGDSLSEIFFYKQNTVIRENFNNKFWGTT